MVGCGCGLEVAYKERIDCFRSGRDIPAGLDEALAGLSGGAPRKSRPPSNWEGVCCFGGGGRVAIAGVSVVLGRTGGRGVSSPPIKSND